MKRWWLVRIAAVGAGIALSVSAQAVLIQGLGGPTGFGESVMGGNDDGFSRQLNLPFDIDFYGNQSSSFFINNNGNATFRSGLSAYTPRPFPVANQPMIAPYWADVDTRCSNCGGVYVASPNDQTVIATWDQVGYYASHDDRTNSFQLVLRDQSDTGAGNFDIEFRYGSLGWTTGDASDGSNGLGGTPAQAGFDAGDGENFFVLPGSFTGDILDIQRLSNVDESQPGVWSFAVRNGTPPGTTPDNPLLPVRIDDSWRFDFSIADIADTVFIDPVLAVGYEYQLSSGPNFQGVVLPTGIGDDSYDLWLFDAILGEFVDSNTDLTGGVAYDFGAGGLDRFQIQGIELAAGLDPFDPTAFVTGLTFAGTGAVSMTQTPLTVNVPAGVPVASSMYLLFAGLLGTGAMGGLRKRRESTL